MKIEIKIPAVGESVIEATIGTFIKDSGSVVNENEEIVELETEKVNQVLYAPKSGVLSWNVKKGDTVNIGDTIGYVDTEGTPSVVQGPSKPEPEQEPPPPPPPPPSPSVEEGARKMASQFVAELKAPQKEQIPEPEPQPPPPPEIKGKKPQEEKAETRAPMSKIRKVIASRLVDALHTAAMLTTFNEADMTAVIQLRNRYKEVYEKKYGVKLGFMSFFVKAVVDALKQIPHLNSYIDNDEIVTRNYYDIGIAVGTEKGLIVPVVRNCDKLSFAEIEKLIAEFAKKAREGKLTISDLEGGGFTITNGGVYGSLLSTPILNPPQSGILGMHKILKRPVVVDDEIVIRPMMYLALSYDHRVVDGKEAVSFLVHIKEVLEDPSRLLFFEEE